jgi:hypothetical protein
MRTIVPAAAWTALTNLEPEDNVDPRSMASLSGLFQAIVNRLEFLKTTPQVTLGIRVATVTPVVVLVTDHVVETNLAAPGPVNFVLPGAPPLGMEVVWKDNKGDCGANNVTVLPTAPATTIDGQANHVNASNWASTRYVYNGTEWSVM